MSATVRRCGRSIMVACLLLGALSWTSVCSAQVISKCPDGKGGFIYQSAPCTQGQSTRDWDGSAHRISPERQAQLDAERRHREQLAATRRAQSTQASRTVHSGGPTASQQQVSRCNAAKAFRESELRRLGLRRTYDILRSLNDHVNRACARQGS